jgi:hypothetical protein
VAGFFCFGVCFSKPEGVPFFWQNHLCSFWSRVRKDLVKLNLLIQGAILVGQLAVAQQNQTSLLQKQLPAINAQLKEKRISQNANFNEITAIASPLINGSVILSSFPPNGAVAIQSISSKRSG